MNSVISSYCLYTCKSSCCKQGKLGITSKEKYKLFLAKALRPVTVEERYETQFINLEPQCPCLDGVYCVLYEGEQRPFACQRFPLFLRRKTIVVANWCPAVQNGILDELIKDLENEGFVICR
jgi:Fe-S-cluster containining protein